ncbi:MAG: YdcF family protein [bacterium]
MTSTIFFVISKLVGLVIVGETWLIVGLIVAAVARWRGFHRLATGCTVLVLAALVTLTAVPVGDWALAPLESRYPANPPLAGPPDGIIILGGAVETEKWRATGQVHLNDQAERVTEGTVLALRFPDARVVLSGGGATLGPIGGAVPSEAEVMAALLTELGVNPARFVLEGQSRNTAGNAELSLVAAKPKPGERWLLVTSASHMPRAMAAFERAGWTGLTAWPVDFSIPPGGRGRTWDLALNLYFLNRAVKEYVGIVAYSVAARF